MDGFGDAGGEGVIGGGDLGEEALGAEGAGESKNRNKDKAPGEKVFDDCIYYYSSKGEGEGINGAAGEGEKESGSKEKGGEDKGDFLEACFEMFLHLGAGQQIKT